MSTSCPIFAQHLPKSCSGSKVSAECRPTCANISQIWAKLATLWPTSTNVGQCFAKFGGGFAQTRHRFGSLDRFRSLFPNMLLSFARICAQHW